jgi:aspartate racemase
MTERVVGVLGGMGPEATVDLLNRVIRATPADDDRDHIRLLIDNNPKVPSRIKAIVERSGESPVDCLISMAQGLQRMGADFLVMPCNTAHYYYRSIAEAVDIPMVNMIALVAEVAVRRVPGLEKVGLLASTAVLVTRLYHQQFEQFGVTVAFPEDPLQTAVLRLIRHVKAGAVEEADIATFGDAAASLAASGAQCLIIACTELSVVADRLRTDLPVLDAAQILAEHVVERAR